MGAIVFGKLPAHGDFVARGLAVGKRDAVDAWLSASLAEAREAMASGFEDRYERALPWRGEGAGAAGAVAASQDATGRRFPVMLLAAGDAERCEHLLYRAIGEGWSADRLAIEAGDAPAGPVERWVGPDGRELGGAMPPGLVAAMLAGPEPA